MGDALTRAQQEFERGTRPTRNLRVTPFREMNIRRGCRYFIKNVIPGGSFVLVYGISGSGKTFFVGYAALCIATAREFLGQRTLRALVVYVAPENPQSVAERFAGMRDELGIDDADLVMISGDLDMLSKEAFSALLMTLQGIVEAHGEIGVVVVDTVSQAMPGADENSPEGMTSFVQACQRIRLDFGCTVVAVHHGGKDERAGARGHSSLRAACDVEIKIVEVGGQRIAELTKVRDGATGLQMPFSLRPISVGIDEDGDAITTCVVESVAATTAAAVQRPRKPKGPVQVLVWEALLRMVDARGRVPPHLGPLSAARGVTIDVLREEAYRSMQQIDGKHRSTRFASALSSLNADGFIGQRDEWVWLPNPGVIPDSPPPKGGEGKSGPRMHPNYPDSGLSGGSGKSGNRGGA